MLFRSTYDIFEVHDNKGVYRMRGKEGWWNIQADDTFTTNGANPQVSLIKLHRITILRIRMCIVTVEPRLFEHLILKFIFKYQRIFTRIPYNRQG